MLERFGINGFEAREGLVYLLELYKEGVLGSGREIRTDLPFDEIGEARFVEEYLHRIAHRIEIGDDLAEGFQRAAEKWGRLEDLKTGIHPAMFWGYPKHYDARTEVYWGYASLISGRDINCHDFNIPAYRVCTNQQVGTPLVSAEELSEIIAEKCIPFKDPLMIDFSDENIYTEHMAKTTAWLMHYSLFWKQTCGLCDNAFADFLNPYGPNNRGITPEGEVRFFKAVTGIDLSFVDSMEFGRKIWNLNRAILVLQGRHRDMESFPDYVYSVPGGEKYCMPVMENGEWIYKNMNTRYLDRDKVEEWKTNYYKLEGWDPKTGWPMKKTLVDIGLKQVTDELERQEKLL